MWVFWLLGFYHEKVTLQVVRIFGFSFLVFFFSLFVLTQISGGKEKNSSNKKFKHMIWRKRGIDKSANTCKKKSIQTKNMEKHFKKSS